MKTTLEIDDELLRATKAFAVRRGASMRRVHERASREFLQREQLKNQGDFRLRNAAVNGNGVLTGIDLGNREQLDELLYG